MLVVVASLVGIEFILAGVAFVAEFACGLSSVEVFRPAAGGALDCIQKKAFLASFADSVVALGRA